MKFNEKQETFKGFHKYKQTCIHTAQGNWRITFGNKFDLSRKCTIIMYINLTGLTSLMMYTKIQPQRFLSSGKVEL